MLTETLTDCAMPRAGESSRNNAGTMERRQDLESMIFSERGTRGREKLFLGALYKVGPADLISGLRARL